MIPDIVRDSTIRNLLAFALVVSAVAVAYLVPHWSTRYGAALVVFTVWMAWFVATFAQWEADER